MSGEDRALGPEMIADGWHVIGGDWIMWLHPPTRRAVAVVPDVEGYLVACACHDEHGYPTSGSSVFVEGYGLALRLARRMRDDILAERPPRTVEQLCLDDAMERRRG